MGRMVAGNTFAIVVGRFKAADPTSTEVARSGSIAVFVYADL
jgi:hypothetical protein